MVLAQQMQIDTLGQTFQYDGQYTQQNYKNQTNFNKFNDEVHQAFKNRILADSKSSILVNPLKSGMYPDPINKDRVQTSYEEAEAVFSVPRQSVVKLSIDLRHLTNYTDKSANNLNFVYGDQGWDIVIYTIDAKEDYTNLSKASIVSLPYIFTRDITQKIDAHLFTIFASKDMFLMFYIRINQQKFSNLKPLLAQSSSVTIKTPSRAIYGQNKIFGFVIENKQLINLPPTMPVMNQDNSYPDTIITYSDLTKNLNSSLINPINITQDERVYNYLINNDKYWINRNKITLPSIPYIGNCQNNGEYLFLSDIVEDQDNCKLYDPKDTISVNPFVFLSNPTSDVCEDVQFTCILDDAFFSSTQYPKFYEQALQAELFKITTNPIDFQQDVYLTDSDFEPLSLIPVILMSSLPSTKLPKEITLEIGYYQVDQYRKRIIKASMTFGQLISKSNVDSNSPFTYKFILNFVSLGHAELAIKFAFGLPIYFVLTSIIGAFSIIMIFFYYCFYRQSNIIFRRVVDLKKPFFVTWKSLKSACYDLWEFLYLYIPQAIGLFLSFVPNFIMQFFISFLMLGGFWSYPFFNCTDLSTEKICETSIFESFGSKQVDQSKRRGRLGLTFIVIGFYAIIRISAVYIPFSQKDKVRESVKNYKSNQSGKKKNKFFEAISSLEEKAELFSSESHDGNIWQEKIWTRGLFIYITILVLIINIVIIYLSFSTYYGANIWFFTFILKATQLVIGELLKLYIEDEILLSSIGCLMAMSTSISGLGAIDFFDYLFNFYVALGISTFEKTSQVIVVDIIVDFVSEHSGQVQQIFSKIFQIDGNDNEENEEEDDEQKNKNDLINNNQENNGDSLSQETGQKDVGNSSIFLTENCQDSVMSIDFQEFKIDQLDDKRNHYKQQNSTNIQNGPKNINSPIANLKDNKGKKLIEEEQTYSEDENDEIYERDFLEEAFEDLLKQKFNKNPESLMVRQQTKANSEQQNIDEQQSTIIKMYTEFHNNTFTLLATPPITVCLWMFFDANQMFVRWGIDKKGIVYYFLFNVLNVPFTMVVDILFQKTNEQFHNVLLRPYHAFVTEKYNSRFLTWKADEEEKDKLHPIIEPDLRNINMWCFSSQYFFCLNIYIAGCIAVTEGVITIIANNYNIFSDSSSFFFIFILWIPICFFFDFLTVQLFLERIWGLKKEEPEEKKDDLKAKNDKNTDDLQKSNNNMSKFKNFTNSFRRSIQVIQKMKPQKQGDSDQKQVPAILSQDNLIMQGSDQLLQNEDNLIFSGLQFQAGKFTNSLNQQTDRNQTMLNQPKQKNTLSQQGQVKQLTFQNTLNSDQHEFYSKLKLSQISSDDNQIEQMKELKEALQNNRYLRLFFEDQIDQLNDYDISVHQFILSFSQQKEDDQDKIYKLFLHNFKRFKLQKDAYDQFKKLKRLDIKKAVQEKEKKTKYQDIKSHFSETEYKDSKFLNKFLKLNKVWLRKNMKLFFDDLIYGESKKELQKLRQLILINFSEIYGEIKVQGNQQEIQVKEVFQTLNQPTKQDIAQMLDAPFVQILKFWYKRSKIQRLAEQLVGGYFLRAESTTCYYCKSNWGLLVQSKNKSVEDLFQDFYKKECRIHQKSLNVLELFENNRIVYSPYVSQQQKLISFNYQNGNALNQNEYLDYFSSPQRSFRDDYEDSENGGQDNSIESIDEQQKQSTKNIYLTNTILFKQKFVDRWQEYFSSHAQLICVCFECNDKAQNFYLNTILEQRKKKERELKLLRETLLLMTDQKSNQNLRAPTLQQQDEQDNQKRDPSLPSYNVNTFNFKKGGENIINSNQVIEEENYEDQSQNEDKLSKFEYQENNISGDYAYNRNEQLDQFTDQNYEYDNQQQDDKLIQSSRSQIQKLSQSQRTIKSEKRTHPQNQNQDDGSEANEDDIKNLNEQIANRSFRVLSARKSSVGQFDDSYQEGQPSELNSSQNSENDSEESSNYQEKDKQTNIISSIQANSKNNVNQFDEDDEDEDEEEEENDEHEDHHNYQDDQQLNQELSSKKMNVQESLLEQFGNKQKMNNNLNDLSKDTFQLDTQAYKNSFQLNEVNELEEENRKSTQKSHQIEQNTERSLENLKVDYIYEKDNIIEDDQQKEDKI